LSPIEGGEMQVQQVLEKILKIEEELAGLNARLLEWNKLFPNKSYSKIQGQFKI